MCTTPSEPSTRSAGMVMVSRRLILSGAFMSLLCLLAHVVASCLYRRCAEVRPQSGLRLAIRETSLCGARDADKGTA